MRKLIFLFFIFFTVIAAQAQQSTYVDTATYSSDMELVADNFDSLEARIASAEAKDWQRYYAGWDWRLRWTRSMVRGLFGADSSLADSLARAWLKNHISMEGDVQQLFAGMRRSLLNLKEEVEQTHREVKQNSQDIHSLAEGFLAQHQKGVKDRGKKKKITLQRIAEIVSRKNPQGSGK